MVESESTTIDDLTLEGNAINDGSQLDDPKMVEREILVVDGEAFDEGKIQSLVKTSKETLKDYHKKTQELSEQRRGLDEREKVLEKTIIALDNAKVALDKDANFFVSHQPEEWTGYEDGFTGARRAIDMPLVGTDQSQGLGGVDSEKISSLEETVKELKSDLLGIRQNTENKDVKETLSFVDINCKKNFPLIDAKAVKDEVFVYYGVEKRLPTLEEIGKMAKANHNRQAKILSLAVKQDPSVNKELPNPTGAGLPKGEKKEVPDLGDTTGATKALKSFLEGKRAQRNK